MAKTTTELRRARLRAFVELWHCRNGLRGEEGGSGGMEVQPPDYKLLAEWLEVPVVAVQLLDGDVSADDLRTWEKWPDARLLLEEYEKYHASLPPAAENGER